MSEPICYVIKLYTSSILSPCIVHATGKTLDAAKEEFWKQAKPYAGNFNSFREWLSSEGFTNEWNVSFLKEHYAYELFDDK